ncbi:hypothetical protein GCM10023175_04030 [Pseudonocardia xishanensis]|uniref:Leucine-binding protein domain-containing protein n=1 Tax=Pseudonocardia xishanensis TaxID=630995 RepID=A0ABP8REF0_9PSEU
MACLAAVTLAACGSSATPGGGGGSGSADLTIRAITNFTGPLALQGIPVQAVQAYFTQLDKKGGVNGTDVTISPQDALGDVSRAVSLTRDAAADKSVLAVVGMGSSAQMEATVPLVDPLKLPSISTPSVSTREAANYYRAAANYPTAGRAAAAFTAETFPGKKVSILTLDTPAPRSATDIYRKGAEAAGLSVVSSGFFPLSATSISNETEAALAANPDVLVVNSATVSVAKTMFDVLKLKAPTTPTVWISNGCSSATLALASTPMYSVCSTLPLSVSGVPAAATIQQALDSAGVGNLKDSLDDSYAVLGYELGRSLDAAVQACAPKCDRDSFGKALAEVHLPSDGMAGELGFQNPDRNMVSQMAVIERDPAAGTIKVTSPFAAYPA